MQLFRTDTETWQGLDLIEGYTSLIWTERFQDAGEFQLKTFDIENTMNALPLNSLVYIDVSDELMFVENHSIAYDSNGSAELTVSGRSFITFLENRFLVNDVYGQAWDMLQSYYYHDAIGALIWNSLCNPTNTSIDGSTRWDISQGYADNVIITTDIKAQSGLPLEDPGNPFEYRDWTLSAGVVYDTIQDWMKLKALGVRIRRPKGMETRYVMTSTYDTTPGASLGVRTTVVGYHTGAIEINIYNGYVRTATPAPENPVNKVIFRYDAGHVLAPSYLLTAKGYKNMVVPMGSSIDVGNEFIRLQNPPDPLPPAPTGFDYRGLLLDLGNVDPVTDADPSGWRYVVQQAEIALRKLQIQTAADGAISPSSTQKFGPFNSYFLGDLVTVVGEYGIVQDMVVSEFVRSQDKDGYKEYPTLVYKT